MGVWDNYRARMDLHGRSARERALRRVSDHLSDRLPDSLSCFRVTINGKEQTVTILNRQDMAEKKICSLPGETLVHGGLVDFAGAKWLITELDANDEVYARGLMLRCNYLLRWIDGHGNLIERWCVVEDGTKYLIGEKTESMMAIGDARIAVTIGKDADTSYLKRGMRFLIDDEDSETPLAYQITKPNKLFNVYAGSGVYRFILTEVNVTDNDNLRLRIADYYNWKPETDGGAVRADIPLEKIVEDAKSLPGEDDGKKVWL